MYTEICVHIYICICMCMRYVHMCIYVYMKYIPSYDMRGSLGAVPTLSYVEPCAWEAKQWSGILDGTLKSDPNWSSLCIPCLRVK